MSNQFYAEMEPMTQEEALAEAKCRWGENAFARENPTFDICNVKEVGYYKTHTVPYFIFWKKQKKYPIVMGRCSDYKSEERFFWEEAFLDVGRRARAIERHKRLSEEAKAEVLAEFAASRCCKQ